MTAKRIGSPDSSFVTPFESNDFELISICGGKDEID